MELELLGEKIRCYDMSPVISARCEETMESIVPDALPDIGGIVDTEGTVLIRDKELTDGAVCVSGVVAVTVIYAPEPGDEAKALHLAVPFTCRAEQRGITGDAFAAIDCVLEDVTARSLNPRKLLTRVNLLLRTRVLLPAELAQGAPETAGELAELKVEQRTVKPVVDVGEKTFSLVDEQDLPSGRPAIGEVLKTRAALEAQEARIIGNKMIFKGTALITLLYRAAEGGELNTVRFELPFSQILELSGACEEPECEVSLFLTGLEIGVPPERGGRSVEFSLHMAVQATVTRTCTLQVVTDAYSLTHDLILENGELVTRSIAGRREVCRSVRELMELPEPVRTVCDLRVVPGEVSVRGEQQKELECGVLATVTYLDGEGALCSCSRKLTVTAPCELPEGASAEADAVCVDDCYALPAAGGAELRFELCFRVRLVETLRCTMLTGLKQGAEKEDGQQPSLVLKTVSEGESLWSLAKRYGSTMQEILRTNNLEAEEQLREGRLLLIPGKRGK